MDLKKHVLSTTVQILDVITSFNLNPYTLMMDRRKKIMKHDTLSNDISFIIIIIIIIIIIFLRVSCYN
jgi:hypothetical protein